MSEIELTSAQRSALREALAPFARSFQRICVFGSRSDGTALPGSDVDLAIFGADEQTTDQIRSAIGESDLSIFADLVRFEGIADPKFRQAIERQAKLLFAAADFQGPDESF